MQIWALTFLDDGLNDEDAVGRETFELEAQPGLFQAAEHLVKLGLAEVRIGPSLPRSFSAWYRLTPRGRKRIDHGHDG